MAARKPLSPTRAGRDPERVRAAALDAAAKLFAERGFSGTSFQDISAACGISMGLIQYHFGSKEQLYESVKDFTMKAYLAAQEPLLSGEHDSFGAFLDAGFRRYFRFFERHARWLRIMAFAQLEGDTRTWPGEDALMDRLALRIRDAQASGELRSDVDPELMLILFAAIMQSWMRLRSRYAARLEHLGNASAQEDAFMGFLIDLFARGVGRAAGAKPPAKKKRSSKG
jgi:TetR/AcrR family transcriptional regulator